MSPILALKTSHHLTFLCIFVAAAVLPLLTSAAEQCAPSSSDDLSISPNLWCKHEAKLILKAPCDVQVEEYFEVPWVAPNMTRTLVVPSGTVDAITASQILSPTSRIPLAILNVARLRDLLINVTIESAETTETRSAFKLQYLMKGALLRWQKCNHDNKSFTGADNSVSWRPGTISPISSTFLSVEFQLPDEFISGGVRRSNIFGALSINKTRTDDRTILSMQLNKPTITSQTNFMAVFYLRKDSDSFGICRKERDCQKEVDANNLKGGNIKKVRSLPVTAWIGIGAGALLFAFLFGVCILCCCHSKKKTELQDTEQNTAVDDGRPDDGADQVISLPMFMRENT